MRPQEVFRDEPRFVALDGADEMPLESKRMQHLDLVQRFLKIIFVKR
jgi:hypothetical protein